MPSSPQAFKAIEQAFIKRARSLRADIWELAEASSFDPYVLARAVDGLDWTAREKLFLDQYNPAIYKRYVDSFDATSKMHGLRQMFGDKDPFAQAHVQSSGASLVRHIDHGTRTSINQAISRTIDSGLNYRRAAREIASLVDLLPQHVVAVQKRRALLLKDGMAPSRVERTTVAYANKLLRYRANNIASYEVAAATEQATLDRWSYGQAQGEISPIAKKAWNPSGHIKMCKTCQALAASAPIPINASWTIFGKDVKRPPGHGSCRCSLSLVLP